MVISMEYLDPNSTYIVAVSFGPDSMALLSMLIKEKYKIVVCHVNYHKRKESNDEEKSLYQYCMLYHIPLYVRHADCPPAHINFQAWAREFRYQFFKEIYNKYHASALLVAHHRDDDLETYFMQKKKLLASYGILNQRVIYDMKVIRPLLNYRKKALHNYCLQNNVPFAIDASNNSDDYERNRIRHQIIAKASDNEISLWIEEKNQLNQKRQQQLEKIKEVYLDNTIVISKFLLLNDEERQLCLYQFISRILSNYKLSKYKTDNIIQAITSKKPNWSMVLNAPYKIVKAYDRLYISCLGEENNYEYILENKCILDTPYFALDFTKDTTNRNIFDYDYPLTIRNYRNGDSFVVGSSRKTLKRIFLDWKIPLELRKIWPVILNNKGEIIYIPRYRENFADDGTNNFIVKSKLGV